MRRIIGLALVFSVVTILGPAGAVLAADEGVISGQVVNYTAGGSSAGGVEVTLIIENGDNQTGSQQKALADSSGRFEFRGLALDKTYVVQTNFQDVDYTSKPVNVIADNSSQSVELAVYDSTTSDEDIQVSNGHIVVTLDQGALHMLEVWRFVNIGDKTFIGKQEAANRSTLQFTLPEGATSFYADENSPVEMTAAGAAYTLAVPPGVTNINFAYFIPYEGSSVTILRKTDYPVADFRLLVEDSGVKVASNALAKPVSQIINGTKYLDFRGSNLPRETSLDASFSDIPDNSSQVSQEPFLWVWLLGGAVLLGIIVIIAYPRLKQREVTAIDQALPVNGTPELRDEKELFMELARLDDSYEDGMLDEKEYRMRRVQLKADLMKLYANNRSR